MRDDAAILKRLLTADDMKAVWKSLYRYGMEGSLQRENLEEQITRYGIGPLYEHDKTLHKRAARVLTCKFDKTPTGLIECIFTIKEWYDNKTLPTKKENDAAIEEVAKKGADYISALNKYGFDQFSSYTFDDYDNKVETDVPEQIERQISVLKNPKTFFRYSPLTNKGSKTKGAPTFFAVCLNSFMRKYYKRPLHSQVATITNTILNLSETSSPKRITAKDVQRFVSLYNRPRKKSPQKKSAQKSSPKRA